MQGGGAVGVRECEHGSPDGSLTGRPVGWLTGDSARRQRLSHFAATAGETLNIVIGGAGASFAGEGGGGGGSFVYRTPRSIDR